MELKNKRAIVTGASKGIGRAVIEQLLEKGAKVAGWGVHAPEYSHPHFQFFETDIRKAENVEKSFRDTMEFLGGEVHILLNNAGLGYFGYFEEMPAEEFYELYEVNVFGIYHACRHIIPVMKAAGKGHIINISSIAGLEAMPQVGAYCGAKFAVRGITESLFKELREFGIKVTGIYPGSVKTDFFRNSPVIKPHDNMMKAEEVAEQIIHALETHDNFLVNEIVFRPLQVKPKK